MKLKPKVVKALNPFNARVRCKPSSGDIAGSGSNSSCGPSSCANVLLLMGMLIQGCQREPAAGETSSGNAAEKASSENDGTAMTQPPPGHELRQSHRLSIAR